MTEMSTKVHGFDRINLADGYIVERATSDRVPEASNAA